MRIILFCIYFFSISFTTYAQSVVTGFRLQQVGNTVKIEFIIPGGVTCNGMDILRSTDSVNFDVALSIAGVCGSTSDDVFYLFTDENPVLNSDNYYRVELKQIGYSSILKIHVIDQTFKASVFPNPSKAVAHIYFSPDYGRTADLSLFSLEGKMLMQIQEAPNSFYMSVEFLENGMYYLQLLTNEQKKLMVILIKQ